MITSKDNVIDIFKNFNLDKKQEMFEQKNYDKFLSYKMKMKSLVIEYNRLNLYQGLRLVTGQVLLQCILKRIEISKQLFIMELE